MSGWDRTVQTRLISLLSAEPAAESRSIRKLAGLLGVSRGKLEYHIRKLRQAGLIVRDGNGVLALADAPPADSATQQMTPALSRRVAVVCDVPVGATSRQIEAALMLAVGADNIGVFDEQAGESILHGSSGTRVG